MNNIDELQKKMDKRRHKLTLKYRKIPHHIYIAKSSELPQGQWEHYGIQRKYKKYREGQAKS